MEVAVCASSRDGLLHFSRHNIISFGRSCRIMHLRSLSILDKLDLDLGNTSKISSERDHHLEDSFAFLCRLRLTSFQIFNSTGNACASLKSLFPHRQQQPLLCMADCHTWAVHIRAGSWQTEAGGRAAAGWRMTLLFFGGGSNVPL